MSYLKNILSAEQIRAADQHTIQHEPISSWHLMERASAAFVNAIESQLQPHQRIAVLCGLGNNGGDGLAVARILMWRGFDVHPFLFMISDKLSSDCETNSQKIDNVQRITKDSSIPDFSGYDVLIDGLFGSGLNRKVSGWPGKIIAQVNNAEAVVYSIDIPSGMYCDHLPEGDLIVQADLVVSFQRPKLCFFFPESSPYIDDWRIVDIGLDEAFIRSLPSSQFVLDELIKERVKSRAKYSHKGTYGHALIVAGTRGKMGAAILSSRACLRSGVGLLTVHVPSCGLDCMQISVPEAMCSIDSHSFYCTDLLDLTPYKCIGIGPGIGQSKETKEALVQLMKASKIPLVLDADALNIVSTDEGLRTLIPKGSILTPHPKEFERLVGSWSGAIERLNKQTEFSRKYNCIVVLKDVDTVISDPQGHAYFNTSGNAGMATGGSGDVLTGIITGLVAQGYSSLEAALIGVYFHGLAGDQAAEEKGMNAVVAGDIINFLRIEKR